MTYNSDLAAAAVKRRDEVRAWVEERGSFVVVARELGVSRQRVRQIVDHGRRVGEPPWRPRWQTDLERS